MFIRGTNAPYLSAEHARPSIDQVPRATLHEVPGGHGPWLVDPKRNAELIQTHLTGIKATERWSTKARARSAGLHREPPRGGR
jgi:hypothetical protein